MLLMSPLSTEVSIKLSIHIMFRFLEEFEAEWESIIAEQTLISVTVLPILITLSVTVLWLSYALELCVIQYGIVWLVWSRFQAWKNFFIDNI